jgi:uncharacterized protein
MSNAMKVIGMTAARRWGLRSALAGVSVLAWALALGVALAQSPTERLAQARVEQLNRALEAYSQDRYADAASGFSALAAQGGRSSADPSVGLARYNLAMMHLREELPRANFVLARRLLEQAAASGVVLANFALSQVHDLGAGVPRNLSLSNAWLEKGAALGHADAQVSLATNYMLGRGSPKNMAQAAHWFREAAKAGDVGAQYLIASLYEQGDGVPQDLRLASYWYGVAAANGDEAAPFKFKALQAQLGEPAPASAPLAPPAAPASR